MNTYYIAGYPVSDELYHHGIKGQKWGIRRYQNEDGTLTAEGRARYGKGEDRSQAKLELSVNRGKDLISKGRTKDGAIARGVGRQFLLDVGRLAVETIGATAAVGVSLTNPAAAVYIAAGIAAAQTMHLGLTGANIAKTYKDRRDIARAESMTYLEKGGYRK